jgi:molybdenum cofactor guanylyltransferase
MGQDKRRLRLGSQTLLGHVRRLASTLSLEVRVIRKDLVPRCGPLGGIYTGLKTSVQDAELFLSCDMPFVSPELLRDLLKHGPPAFVEHAGTVGFPAVLRANQADVVEAEIRAGRLSLQNLARRLRAKRFRLTGAKARQLFNINTPADWAEAQRSMAELPL